MLAWPCQSDLPRLVIARFKAQFIRFAAILPCFRHCLHRLRINVWQVAALGAAKQTCFLIPSPPPLPQPTLKAPGARQIEKLTGWTPAELVQNPDLFDGAILTADRACVAAARHAGGSAARIWDSFMVCAETMLASMNYMDDVKAIGAGESYEVLHYAVHGQGKAGSGLGQ